MLGIGKDDILKRHIVNLKDIEKKKFKLRQVEPLTRKEILSLVNQFRIFIDNKDNASYFADQADFLIQHRADSYDLFTSTSLPNYSTQQLLGLSLIYFHNAFPEEKLFGVGENTTRETLEQYHWLYELFYYFNVLYRDLLFKPEYINYDDTKMHSLFKEAFIDLVILLEERAFWLRLTEEIDIRLGRSPICYNVYSFIKERRKRKDGGKHFLPLLKMSKAKVRKLFHPLEINYKESEEKDSELNVFLLEEIQKIDKLNPGITLLEESIDHKFCYFTGAIENRFNDLIKKYDAKKRTPNGGLVSLDEFIIYIKTAGTKAKEGKGKFPAEAESILSNPSAEKNMLAKEKVNPIKKHRALLEKEVGKAVVRVLEIMYHLEEKGENPTQEAIAEASGKSVTTIKRYWKKCRGKLEIIFTCLTD